MSEENLERLLSKEHFKILLVNGQDPGVPIPILQQILNGAGYNLSSIQGPEIIDEFMPRMQEAFGKLLTGRAIEVEEDEYLGSIFEKSNDITRQNAELIVVNYSRPQDRVFVKSGLEVSYMMAGKSPAPIISSDAPNLHEAISLLHGLRVVEKISRSLVDEHDPLGVLPDIYNDVALATANYISTNDPNKKQKLITSFQNLLGTLEVYEQAYQDTAKQNKYDFMAQISKQSAELCGVQLERGDEQGKIRKTFSRKHQAIPTAKLAGLSGLGYSPGPECRHGNIEVYVQHKGYNFGSHIKCELITPESGEETILIWQQPIDQTKLDFAQTQQDLVQRMQKGTKLPNIVSIRSENGLDLGTKRAWGALQYLRTREAGNANYGAN